MTWYVSWYYLSSELYIHFKPKIHSTARFDWITSHGCQGEGNDWMSSLNVHVTNNINITYAYYHDYIGIYQEHLEDIMKSRQILALQPKKTRTLHQIMLIAKYPFCRQLGQGMTLLHPVPYNNMTVKERISNIESVLLRSAWRHHEYKKKHCHYNNENLKIALNCNLTLSVCNLDTQKNVPVAYNDKRQSF